MVKFKKIPANSKFRFNFPINNKELNENEIKKQINENNKSNKKDVSNRNGENHTYQIVESNQKSPLNQNNIDNDMSFDKNDTEDQILENHKLDQVYQSKNFSHDSSEIFQHIDNEISSKFKSPNFDISHPDVKGITYYVKSNPIKKILKTTKCQCSQFTACPKCEDPVDQNTSFKKCPCLFGICKPCNNNIKLHELALVKAIYEKKVLKYLNNNYDQMKKTLDVLSSNLDSVIKYEGESIKYSKELQETKLKAFLARKQMLENSEKAKLLAKETLSINHFESIQDKEESANGFDQKDWALRKLSSKDQNEFDSIIENTLKENQNKEDKLQKEFSKEVESNIGEEQTKLEQGKEEIKEYDNEEIENFIVKKEKLK